MNKKIISLLTISSFAVFGFLVAPSAFAGVGLGVVPNLPTSVTVGDTNVPATENITNLSTDGEGLVVELTHIHFTPSCGQTAGHVCSMPDPNVFSVSAAGTGSGQCAGINFTLAVDDVTTGQVLLTPSVPVQLPLNTTCIINFTVDVLNTPTLDSSVSAGLQTDQIGHAVGFDTATPQLQGQGLGNDQTTVNKVSPEIRTIPSAGGTVGTILNDMATLTGGFNPTGDVTFMLFPPADSTCEGNPVYTEVDPSAPYQTSPGYVSLVPGTYHWLASYAGDANNNPAVSLCADEPVVIIAELVIEKTADTSFDRAWDWTINKTGSETNLLLAETQSFDVNYTIVVDETPMDINHMVSGTITVTNPVGNPSANITSITDMLDESGSVTIVCDETLPFLLVAGDSINCTYSESVSDKDDTENTVTVVTTGDVPGGSDSADVNWGSPDNLIDECIVVDDTYLGGPQDAVVCYNDVDKTFNYTITFGPEGEGVEVPVVCGPNNHPNIASFTTQDDANDTDEADSDDWNVMVTVECVQGCTLTMGYWKTHNDSFKGGAPTDETWDLLGASAEQTGFFTLTAPWYPMMGPNTAPFSWFTVFWTAPKGNAYYQLAHQYMATKLNISAGASAPASVTTAITAAENFFDSYTPSVFNALGKKDQLRKDVLMWAGIFGDFNEGEIGPGHCDEQNPQE